VFRGIAFRLLEPAVGTGAAVGLTAVIFGVVHLPNLHDDVGASELLKTFTSVALISAFWTVLYARVRNLWFVTLHHAAWNFSIVISGASLSGVDEWRAAAPFASVDHGPAWLTGGRFGPEDSVITIALVAACLLVSWRIGWMRSASKQPATAQREPIAAGVVALTRAAQSLTELWSPRVVAEVDDYYVKVAKVHGEFGWHSHAEDELFVILRGSLSIRMDATNVLLEAGECYVVRKGLRHNPHAREECLLMLFERKSTLHAGADGGSEKARSLAEQLRPLPPA
jgi:mannose-6-phosphate isomerase-like protein (cupin superfamily)